MRAYIYCEYVLESDSGDENAKKHGDGRWHVRGKAYLYNPHCCNPNGRMNFMEGFKVKMPGSGGSFNTAMPPGNLECVCDENGGCTPSGAAADNCCGNLGLTCGCQGDADCGRGDWQNYGDGNEWCRQRYGNEPYCCVYEKPIETPTETSTPPTCFPVGTLIYMADGTYKPIELVKPGDYVIGYDFATGKNVVEKVLEIETPPPIRDNVCTIVFDDNLILRLTWDHPIYTTEGIKAIRPETSAEREVLNITKLEVGDIMYRYVSTNIYSNIYHHYYLNYLYYLNQESIANIIPLPKIMSQNIMPENTTTQPLQPLSQPLSTTPFDSLINDGLINNDLINNGMLKKVRVVSISCISNIAIQAYNLLNITSNNNYYADNILVHNDVCDI